MEYGCGFIEKTALLLGGGMRPFGQNLVVRPRFETTQNPLLRPLLRAFSVVMPMQAFR